ncbi:MAG: NADH-quinone oxidoreductase subunit J, partial [Desulfobulbaceae bacterium]|nr:NADH-quinone oxidoreductase subunit J [Desulfobulbaceae bacterium]
MIPLTLADVIYWFNALFTAEGLAGVVFLCMMATVVAGAVFAVTSARLIRSVTGLALCFIGVAGIYYFLNSPFVALMEILIYVGAVCITISFAIMLAEPRQEDQGGRKNAMLWPMSAGAAVLLFWGLTMLAGKAQWPAIPTRINNGSLEDVGISLLTTYSMVFELISLVLLV